MFALNRANDAHSLWSIAVSVATLLDDRKRGVEAISEPTRLLCKTLIGRDDGEITQFLLCKVTSLKNLRSEFVNRDIEEALNLARVHIHREHAMSARDRDTVCDQASGDGNARLILLIGTAIGIVGDDGGDAGSGGAFKRIDHDQQFHNGAVDRRAEGLDDEHIAATYIIIDFHEDIFVAKLKNICITQWNMQVLTDSGR